MKLTEYMRALGRQWRWAILAYAIVLVLTLMVTELMPKVYSSRAEVFFSVNGGVSAPDLNQGAGYTERQMASYKTLAASSVVLVPAIKESRQAITVEQLAGNVRTDVIADTTIMTVEVLDSSPAKSAALANAVAKTLGATAETLSPRLQSGISLVKSTILIEAKNSLAPALPNRRTNTMLGNVAALAVALLVAVIVDRIDPRFRSLADVRRVNAGPLFPALPNSPTDGTTIALRKNDPVFLEAMRRVVSRLRVSPMPATGAVCIVMSARDGDGKTTVAIELAAGIAETGIRVLVVLEDSCDSPATGDLRFDRLGGLATLLRPSDGNSSSPESFSSRDEDESWSLIGDQTFGHFISKLRQEYDMVIVDSPSLLRVPEGVLLATQTDGALFIVDMMGSRRRDVFGALDMLRIANVPVLGILPNRTKEVRSRPGVEHVGEG